MGNEVSSQDGRPPTILAIEAVLWPTEAVVFCTVSLRERDSSEDRLLGEVKRFPGRPLAVLPRHISSILVLSFRAADGADDAELASLCIPISSLVQFGAPLFTSLWLGLQEGRMETKFESALKYAKSAKAPKVRIAFFRPSLKSFKELEPKKDEDSLDSGKKLKAEGDTKGTQAEPDIFAALATDVDGPGGLVGRDSGPSLAQQILGIMKGLRASNEMVWALQTALFARAVLPQQTQESTAMLTQDAAPILETIKEVRARIRVTISEYRGLQNMCCACEVPGYSDLEFKMHHGTATLSGAGSNLVVGASDYAECEAYPVGHPLRFAARPLGPGSDQEEALASCDLEGDAFYPDGYRGDLMLLDANGGARGTVKVSIDIIPDEPEQCQGEVPFNDATCHFQAEAASAELCVMLAREGLDIIIDSINEVMLGDFAKKWGKRQSLISTFWPARAKADTKMNMLPLPTPVKIDQSKAGEGASQEKRQKDWALVESELVEYLTILNSMLESFGITLQLNKTEQKAVCIIVKWQPQTLAASRFKHRDGDGEMDPRILHQRIEEQQQVFSEEVAKLRRQHTESVLSASQNLSTVRDEFLQQSSELKLENERLQSELETSRNKQAAASSLEQATHVKRSLDQAASDLETSLNREKALQERCTFLEKAQAELEEKHSCLTSFSGQQVATIEYLTALKESSQKEAAERELIFEEMKTAITQAATKESLLSQRITHLEALGAAPVDTKVETLEAALAESMNREAALRQTLDEAGQREAESLERVRNASMESAEALQTALKESVAKETAMQQALEQATQREAALKEQYLQVQEDASKAAARVPEMEEALSDASKRETTLKEDLDQAKGREGELRERMRSMSDETSKTWQVALREAAERESLLREAVEQAAHREAAAAQRDVAWKAALDEAGERENALREALEQSAEREATETANLKEVALQEVTAALREVEEKDIVLQEVLAKHAALEHTLHMEQSQKETALKNVDSTLGEAAKKETAMIQALGERELQLEQALKKEAAVLEELQQREADLEQIRLTAADLQEKLRQTADRESARDAEAERKDAAFREALAQKEADLEQVLAREASLHASLNSQNDLEALSNASYKQMAQEAQQEVAKLLEKLEEEKATALFHKQAAVRGTDEIAIKGEQLKEATRENAYLKEAVEREAALKDVVLEEVASKERELREERQLVADLQEQFRQAADREKGREMEEKWKELQRQLQGSQKELQKSREVQFQLEEQLVANEAQQAKLRAELQVKQDIEAHKEELIAKVRLLEAEVAKTQTGLQGKAPEPPKSMPDVATLHMQVELGALKQQVEEAEGSQRMLEDAKHSAIFMELVKTRQDLEFERSKSAQDGEKAHLAQTQEAHRRELDMLKRQLEKERVASQSELVMGHQNDMHDLERRQDEAIQLLERRSQAVVSRLKSRFTEVLRLQPKGQADQVGQQIMAQLQAGMDECQAAISEPMMSAKQDEDIALKSFEAPSAQPVSPWTGGSSRAMPEPEMQVKPVSTTASPVTTAVAPAVSRVMTPSQQFVPSTSRPALELPISQRTQTPSPQQVSRTVAGQPGSSLQVRLPAGFQPSAGVTVSPGSSLQVRANSPIRVRGVQPSAPSIIQAAPLASGASISGISPPATFDCAPMAPPPRTQTPKYLPQPRTAVAAPAAAVAPQQEVKKATVRCVQCGALNMIQLDGPPTIQCGGCGYEFQVDPNILAGVQI